MEYKIFGCKVNKYYLNKWLNYFDQEFSDNENKFIIATCEVTDRAKSKRVKCVKGALAKGKEVYVTGCGALKRGEVISDGEFYSIYPELLKFKKKIHILGETPNKITPNPSLPKEGNIYTKKYVVIQNGCDNHCTFCLTIKKRGRHVSFPLQEIINEIKDFERSGGKEIVLTGINLAARGCSNSMRPEESRFVFLLKEILKQTTIPRIRISSLGPEYLDDEFFEVIKDSRILKHFHLSVQSFSDAVLKNMKRNYTAAFLKNILYKFNGYSIGADIIVGFPGESEEDFEETLKGIKEFGITKMHAFPFSAHEKGETVPAKFLENQVSKKIKDERMKRILDVADAVRKKFIEKNIAKKHKVLVEGGCKNGIWYGWTGNYIQVGLTSPPAPLLQRGEIVEIVLKEEDVVRKDANEE